jgi:hypothetical protein
MRCRTSSTRRTRVPSYYGGHVIHGYGQTVEGMLTNDPIQTGSGIVETTRYGVEGAAKGCPGCGARSPAEVGPRGLPPGDRGVGVSDVRVRHTGPGARRPGPAGRAARGQPVRGGLAALRPALRDLGAGRRQRLRAVDGLGRRRVGEPGPGRRPAGCGKTDFLHPTTLPDGRLGLTRLCLDPPDGEVGALDPATSRYTALAPVGPINPDAVTWRKDLRSGYLSRTSGSCAGIAPLTRDGAQRWPAPVGIGGKSWELDGYVVARGTLPGQPVLGL